MHWIYFSPHFDDAVLSCGGLIWEQAQRSDSTSVWTICAGDPPDEHVSAFTESLHARWQTGVEAVAQRRLEDVAACTEVNASYRYFSIPDCIYRRAANGGPFLYPSREALFGPLASVEQSLVLELATFLADALSSEPYDGLVCPLALGGHVDHRLVRAAVEIPGKALWYYADYPYVLDNLSYLEDLKHAGWQATIFPISQAGLEAWQAAVTAYQSQISTFWLDLPAMHAAISAYLEVFGGLTLLRSP